MKHLRVDRLIHYGRVLLLVTASLALGTAAVWAWRPEWVGDLDKFLLERHMGQAERALEAAQAAEPGSGKSIARYERLLRQLEDVRSGDRLGDVRIDAMDGLVSSHEAAGDMDAALAVLEDLVEFTPKHLPARLDFARHLHLREERQAEGLEQMAELFELMPEDARVAEAYVDMLMALDQPEAALEAALDHDQRARSILWRMYWKSNPSGNERQALLRPRIGEDGVLRLTASVEGPVRHVRMVLPERQAMTLVNPALQASFDGKLQEVSLLAADVTRVGMNVNGNELSTNGRTNAFFELELTCRPKTTFSELSLVAPFRFEYSSVLSKLASRPRMARVIASSGQEVDPQLVRDLVLAGLRSSAGGVVEVFWGVGDKPFSGERRTAAGLLLAEPEGTAELELDFSVTVPLAQTARRLRVDLPDGRGMHWDVDVFEVQIEGRTVALDPESLELVAINSIERNGARFTVSGKDPWLVIVVPDERAAGGAALEVDALTLSGSVSK